MALEAAYCKLETAKAESMQKPWKRKQMEFYEVYWQYMDEVRKTEKWQFFDLCPLTNDLIICIMLKWTFLANQKHELLM